MTANSDYHSCAIFFDGADRQAVTDLIATSLATTANRHALRIGDVDIYVVPNGWAGTSADFTGWPVKIDIESNPSGPDIVGYTARILTAAWNLGYRAVAACDFEDELPDEGGRSRPDGLEPK